MIEINDVLFNYSPRWLYLLADESQDGPAIYLTPLDWTQYEFCRRAASIMGTDNTNPRVMLAQLVKLSNPTKWRGIVKGGQELAFDSDILFKVLCSNLDLGVAFDLRLRTWAQQAWQHEVDALKNSRGGRATSDTPPTPKTDK